MAMNEIKKENKKEAELKQIQNKIKGRKIWMSKNEERKRNRGQTDKERRENVKWTEKIRLFKEKKTIHENTKSRQTSVG